MPLRWYFNWKSGTLKEYEDNADSYRMALMLHKKSNNMLANWTIAAKDSAPTI